MRCTSHRSVRFPQRAGFSLFIRCSAAEPAARAGRAAIDSDPMENKGNLAIVIVCGIVAVGLLVAALQLG